MERFNALSGKGKVGVGCLALIALSVVCSLCSTMLTSVGLIDPTPTPAPAPTATITPDLPPTAGPTIAPYDTEAPPEPAAASGDVQSASDEFVQHLEAFNAATSTSLFLYGVVAMRTSDTPGCTATVSDDWYALPKFQKERILGAAADLCVTATAGIRDDGVAPETYIVDTEEKRVARRSNLGFDSIEDE